MSINGQTEELFFDDMSVEHPEEVLRVLRFWEQDNYVREYLGDMIRGDFRMFCTPSEHGIRSILLCAERGYQFTFHVYQPTNDPMDALRQFDEFILANLHTANEWLQA